MGGCLMHFQYRIVLLTVTSMEQNSTDLILLDLQQREANLSRVGTSIKSCNAKNCLLPLFRQEQNRPSADLILPDLRQRETPALCECLHAWHAQPSQVEVNFQDQTRILDLVLIGAKKH